MNLSVLGAVILGLVAAWFALLVLLWLIRPRGVRVALVILLVWLVSPIDLVPEFIPVLGPLDDVIVAVVILRYVRRRLGEPEMRRHWRGSDDGWLVVERLVAGRGVRGAS